LFNNIERGTQYRALFIRIIHFAQRSTIRVLDCGRSGDADRVVKFRCGGQYDGREMLGL
jgi:hypothetical protein